MPKPVCVSCKTEFQLKKNGVVALETIGPVGDPYKIWSSDLWECPRCHSQILSGYGLNPLSHRGDPDFREYRKKVEIIFY
jgi:DNA-directed RNA polymerase subunit RPC12/RpoP